MKPMAIEIPKCIRTLYLNVKTEAYPWLSAAKGIRSAGRMHSSVSESSPVAPTSRTSRRCGLGKDALKKAA